MPISKTKQYALISQRLEKMADGVAVHSKEENFPPQLKEKDLRDKRNNLESLRQSYDELMTKARQSYDVYAEMAEKLETDLSKFENALYGFYGKRDQTLTDFGLTPWKKSGKTGPQEKKGQI